MVLRSQASGKEAGPLDVGVADVAPGSAMAFNPVRPVHYSGPFPSGVVEMTVLCFLLCPLSTSILPSIVPPFSRLLLVLCPLFPYVASSVLPFSHGTTVARRYSHDKATLERSGCVAMVGADLAGRVLAQEECWHRRL